MNIHDRVAAERPEGLLAADERHDRRTRLRIVAVVVALVVAALAILLMTRQSGPATGDAAAGSMPGVTVIIPGRRPVTSTVNANGSIAAIRDMPVGVAGEGGRVARVLVDAGATVAQGQVLAVIDRSVETQQAAQLTAQIRAARADADLAQSELDRAEALVARGFISRADIQRRTATRDAAMARVTLAEAQLAEMRARIGRLDIRAPAAGRVLARNVEAGQIVSPGSSALFRIAEHGAMELRAQVAEQDLGRMKVGQPAEVTPVGESRNVTGSIWLMAAVIDPQTRQGIVRIRLPDDPGLRPGGFATARIATGSTEAPVLPESAVLNDAKGSFVYLIDGDDKVVRRDITLGDVSDDGLVVSAGLNGDERVVQSAGAFLTPGETVRPERAAAPGR